MALLGHKVTTASVGYDVMLGAGIVKYAEERLLSAYIGNATLMSGVIKGAIGYGAHRFLDGGLIGNSVALGFTTDAVEDILTAVLGGAGIFGGNAGSNW